MWSPHVQKNGKKKRTGRTGSTVGSQLSKHYKAQKKASKKNKELHETGIFGQALMCGK
jgi:hypothetical protein